MQQQVILLIIISLFQMFLKHDDRSSESQSQSDQEYEMYPRQQQNYINRSLANKIQKKQQYQDYETYSKKKQKIYQSAEDNRKMINSKNQLTEQLRQSRSEQFELTKKLFQDIQKDKSQEYQQILMKKADHHKTQIEIQKQDRRRYKQLLQLEIKKNRELQHRVFLREKLIVELRTQNDIYQNQNKRLKAKYELQNKNKKNKIKKVKEIEQKINLLKSRCREVQTINSLEKYKKIADEANHLRNENRRYKKFVKAFGQSLSIFHQNKSMKDIKDVWSSWKNLLQLFFQKIGKEN